ncbi:MAG TPA: hypothetical protein VNA25_21450 [Phycisphaerae bacterium]|nr:hypothetical protein [Phycisphaerae bacterium]HUT60419.1 hypothetical protein [Phycisphaerae bacterium]
MNRTFSLGVLLAVVFGLIAGCNETKTATTGPAGPVEELQAQVRPPLSDVPMPVKFKYKDNKSRSFDVPGIRFVDHVYTGPSEKFAVARFFRNQMPLSGWSRKTETQVQGIVKQEFDKDGETCRITLSDHGLFGGTKVQVEVYPSGRAPGSGGPRE